MADKVELYAESRVREEDVYAKIKPNSDWVKGVAYNKDMCRYLREFAETAHKIPVHENHEERNPLDNLNIHAKVIFMLRIRVLTRLWNVFKGGDGFPRTN